MAQLPDILDLLHQPGFHALLRSQRKQLGPQHRRCELRDGLAHQQRLFLPVPTHELRGAQAAEQGEGLLDIHENLSAHLQGR